jgi:hypothetical protein
MFLEIQRAKYGGSARLIQVTFGKHQSEITRFSTTDADSALAEANTLRLDSHSLTSFHNSLPNGIQPRMEN